MLGKISWFAGGEHFFFLAEANNWSARHWQITLFGDNEFNNCFIIRSPSLFFNEYLREVKRSAIKKEKSVVSFTHEHSIICSQTQLENIAHEQSLICR